MKYKIVNYTVLEEQSRKPSHTDDMIPSACVHMCVHFTHVYKHQKKTTELYQTDNAYLRK